MISLAVLFTSAIVASSHTAPKTAPAPPPRPNLKSWKEAQEKRQNDTVAQFDRSKKMAAVNKAVEMLEGLREQIFAEGESEVASYNKFACFCKDTTSARLASISTGEDEKTQLENGIATLDSARDVLDVKIETKIDAIAAVEQEIEDANGLRHAALKLYKFNAADLSAALEALRGALRSLRASKVPSLVQVQTVAQTVRTALVLADALGLAGASTNSFAFFLQQPANNPANTVKMEDYKYHSDGIIKTLEDLQAEFISKKQEVDRSEVDAVSEHEEVIQTKTNTKRTLNRELSKARKDKDQKMSELAKASEMLTTVEATLKEDKQYTDELSKICTEKAKTWDQRSRVRADELSTLTSAIDIIRGAVKGNTTANTIRFAQQAVSVRYAKAVALDSNSMRAIEAEAEQEESAPAFLQRISSNLRGVRQHPERSSRDMIVGLLKSQGKNLKSSLLTALASQISADPFAKVKQLVQELIERLLQEATNEANQKGWCDKATSEASQKRDRASEDIKTLNAQMVKLEANNAELLAKAMALGKEKSELRKSLTTATDARATEKTQNEAIVTEAQEGLDALDQCIDLLDKFYKTINKEKVNLTLIQGPGDDAPDAGFANGEAYLGAQSEAGGILGMLDVMKSDFTRTIRETTMAEDEAKQTFLDFSTETGMAQKEVEVAMTETQGYYGEGQTAEMNAQDNLEDTVSLLTGALQELMDLKPVCVDTGMSYTDREALREDEIASLNKALCVLDKYAQYGPDGAASGC